MNDRLERLPVEPADRVTRPLLRFMRTEAVAGLVLLICTLAALVLSNSAWSDGFLAFWELEAGFRLGEIEFSRSLKHWINEGLMTIFFFVIALELKRELVLGELRDPRVAALPIAAAFGGMALPVGVFLILMGDREGANGWGTVMSTDTAFVIGCLAILGSRIPQSLRLFLLSLAIFDDIGAILVVAVAYSGPIDWLALGLAALGVAAVAGVAYFGIRNLLLYVLLGCGIWLAVDASGVHATLAGVVLGLMTPAHSWVSDRRLHLLLNRVTAYPPGDHWSSDTSARRDLRHAGIAAQEAVSPIERLEFMLHPWMAFGIMPLFALANAGVALGGRDFEFPLLPAIVLAFVVGKPLGILLFSFLAVRVGVAVRPDSLSWNLIGAAGLLAGIGFTMALFIADAAFAPDLLETAKLGIMGASIVSTVLGFFSLLWIARFSATARVGRSAWGRL